MADTTAGPAPTARQRRILEFIATTVRERGYPPTVREIGRAVGLTSSSSVHAQLANLERMGLLRRDATKPRAVTLAEAGYRADAVPVPLVGRVAAGAPILAEEHIEGYLGVPASFVGEGGEHFALRVRGESMIGAGILDGDVVVVRKQETARSGDIVVALVGDDEAADEATVKTFYREPDGRIRLQPQNRALEPLYPSHVEVIGKVTGVFRSLE